ncbi:D-2-hydroxyacid dehydrogenase [Helicobacter cholecystus]|uniref:D-2-hydroxyacid dehydrogenase n=1 Tax=Helicobacter cholecystus TaxID=45498 RepID=A0A3D8IS99_9HELI|nr:D-2-hydroxyacid dehydrogenase [Helicobacter cholecystus]RDU68149.1 D-2-hydroxyacid dehydrogenase [Helicobacter cholecystus]VEJ24521.1 putative D-2-hydroxyacid dehydrogenase [Helicobacter cholecystus]
MKIVILDSLTLGEVNLKQFEDFGDLSIYPCTTKEEILPRCEDAQIIITCKVPFDAQTLSYLPKLKLIALTSTGTNIIDLIKAKELGIEVRNVAGYSTFAVAQHTLMFVLALLAKLPFYDEYCKSSQWCSSPVFTHIVEGCEEIADKEWGIIGFGNIGKQTAKLAQALGAKVSYTSTSGKNQDHSFPQKSLNNLLSTSDIITIHAPLNPQTHHLLSASNLSLLKNEAILVNVGRGGIIDEDALTQRMLESEIAFGSDVLECEPLQANHPLLHPSLRSRLLLTPHTAWAYRQTRERLIKSVYTNIQNFLEGN